MAGSAFNSVLAHVWFTDNFALSPRWGKLSHQRNKSLITSARPRSLSLRSERYISLRPKEGIPCPRRGLFVKISAEFFAHRLRPWGFVPPSVTPMMGIG